MRPLAVSGEVMRLVRIIIAGLLALSLGILPVSAAMAMSKAHAAQAEMSMGAPADDCPCCNVAKKCGADLCQFKCFSTPAISVENLPLPQPRLLAMIGSTTAAPSPFNLRPEPPPPRS